MSATARFQLRSEGSTDVMLLDAAIEACPESLAVIENGCIIYANRAFTRMFGFSHTSEVQGRKFAELLPEDDRCADLGTESTVPSEKSGYAHPPLECSSSRLDGTRVHVRTSCAGFHINGRNLLVISTRDISERKQAEQQWRESQKMEAIGRLVSGVAHDFNNLLTGIMLCCDLLIAGLRSDRRLRYHAEEIRMAGEHGTALIQQLLAVARQQAVEPQVISWNEVISGMRDLLARLIGENIELGTSLADDLGRVRMDPSQARQIVLNLVLNARDAMPGGGQIALVTMNRGDCLVNSHNPECGFIPCVELMVMDTGCGMDAETRSHLFEAFFTTKKPGQGNGLGLMTVHTIVKQGGGTIGVESAPGRGTQVFVRLPRLSNGFEALPPVAQNDPVRTGQETGLPVEDNSALPKPVQQGSERK
jgi:two-component system cell cycle sensor histidine kinase/response regulator CckA